MNCGQINHYKCDQEKICFKCGEGDHTTDKCKKALRCVNCKRSHRCDSEECELLRKKTYQLNDYTISILLGESVISHIGKILKNPEHETNASNFSKEDISEIVGELIDKNQIVLNISERLAKQEMETKIIKQELVNLNVADMKIQESVDKVKSDVASLNTKVDKMHDQNMLAHNVTSQKHDETNNKLTELINMLTKASCPLPIIHRNRTSKKD